MFKVIKTGDGKRDKNHSCVLTTDNFDIEFDSKTGLLKKLFSKKTGKQFTDILKPQCFEDLADSECFNVNTYGNKLEDFAFQSIETVESGEFRTVLKAKYKFRESLLTLYYSFYRDTDYFDVRYTVNWNEDHIVLKLMSKTGYENLIVSSPFATEVRGDCTSDFPMGEWLSMYGKDDGISFIGDSSFAYAKSGDELGISILRSCIYAEMTLEDEMPKEDYPIMEQGICEGSIRIVMHKGDYIHNDIAHMAKAFVNSPIVFCEANHDGVYPAQLSFVSVGDASVYVTAIKQAEKGVDDVVRLNEFAGMAQEITLKYFDREFKVSMKPYEIKTIIVKEDSYCEVNITED